jgi:hypothetical protein
MATCERRGRDREGSEGRSSNPGPFRPSRLPEETENKKDEAGKVSRFVRHRSTGHPRSALFSVESMGENRLFLELDTSGGFRELRPAWRPDCRRDRRGGASRTCRTRLVHGSLRRTRRVNWFALERLVPSGHSAAAEMAVLVGTGPHRVECSRPRERGSERRLPRWCSELRAEWLCPPTFES